MASLSRFDGSTAPALFFRVLLLVASSICCASVRVRKTNSVPFGRRRTGIWLVVVVVVVVVADFDLRVDVLVLLRTGDSSAGFFVGLSTALGDTDKSAARERVIGDTLSDSDSVVAVNCWLGLTIATALAALPALTRDRNDCRYAVVSSAASVTGSLRGLSMIAGSVGSLRGFSV